MSTEPEFGRPLPNAALARCDHRKFTEYALSPDSESGRHKARVFESVLGFVRDDWRELRDRIVADLRLRPVSNHPEGPYPSYQVHVLVEGLNDRHAWVVTGWKMVDGIPWLTSLRVATADAQTRLDEAYPDAEAGTK